MFDFSKFANDITCMFCSKKLSAPRWPVNGDEVGFYYQREPGKYQVPILCPHCHKEWYVVWDDYPGPGCETGTQPRQPSVKATSAVPVAVPELASTPTGTNISAPEPGVAATDSPLISGSGLKFDGVYQSEKRNDYFYYLRFYEDGTVIEVSSTGSPQEVARWFDRKRSDLARGRCTITGNHIVFTVESAEGKVDYDGRLVGQEIDFHTYSHIKQRRGRANFKFVTLSTADGSPTKGTESGVSWKADASNAGKSATAPEPKEVPDESLLIRWSCVACGRAVKTSTEHAGKKGKCPRCGKVQTVPATTATVEPSQADPTARSKPREPGPAPSPGRETTQDEPEYARLPPDVAAAWKRAGAHEGWMDVNRPDTLFDRGAKPGCMPCLRLMEYREGTLPTVISPPVPFGLILGELTDAGVKEIADLEKLQYLSLIANHVTDAGLTKLAGLKQLRRLRLLRATALMDAGLKQLAALKGLQTLELDKTKVTGAGLKHLAVLQQLQSLYIDSTQFTDAGLKELGALKKLQKLSLHPTVQLETRHLSSKQVTDAALKHLTSLEELRTLRLAGTGVTDAGLKELVGLKKLETLDLSCTKVTDAGLKELAGLKQLHTLDLAGTPVTDARLKDLAGLKQLQTLHVARTQVTDAGLKWLAGLKHLQSLFLSNTRVTEAGLKKLVGLKQLQTLDLAGTQVTDAGLKQLATLKQLQTLHLASTQVTDAGLESLAGLEHLQSLFLSNTPVTDAELRKLAGLKQLQTLWVNSTQMTDAGLKHLASLQDLRTLYLGGRTVTDAGLKHLTSLEQLETLSLTGTSVTDAGLKELAGVLPDLMVYK